MRQQVLILRHGESEWNREHRWQGWIDIPLSPDGQQQAKARARELARDGFRPRAIYTSDLQRAARTAEIIGGHLDVPVIPDAGFRERNGGEWQGHTSAEIDELWPGLLDAWSAGQITKPPGGEEDADVLTRFDAALVRALAHVGNGMLAILTHGGVLHLIATRAGSDVHQVTPNLGGYWFDVAGNTLCNPVALDTLRVDDERPSIE